MVLTIYDRADNPRAELAPNDSSTQAKAIQGDNVLTLSFTLYEHVELDVDDYVDFEGERYWLTEQYRPKQKSTMEWVYDLKLYGVESMIKRLLVIKTVDNEEEPVFTLTAPPRDHVALIVKCMNNGMGNITDWKVGQVDGTENIVIDYFGKYCDEALKEIAEKVGAEWWVEGQTVNICRCEHGEPVTLGYDKGLASIDPSKADNVKFYTRLYPVGSSRNIDREKYGFTRLQLPGGQKYVEINADKYGRVDHFEQSAFEEIYPRRIGSVSSVRSEVKPGEDGNPFTIYYFTDDSLPFDPNDYMIGGLVMRVSFQEGSELAGLGEEDNGTYFFEVNFNSKTREFEIITIWPYDNDIQLPGDRLIPKATDKYILWNLRMPDEYYTLAEEEFLAAVNKFNDEHNLDISVYKAPTDHVWIEDNNVELTIGRRVRLESEKYFPGVGYRDSRITKITRKVNLPSSMDIEISDALSRTALQKMTDSISEVKSYASSIRDSIPLPDIIRTGDKTRPTENNLFSARKCINDFLSKATDDRTAYKLSSDKAFEVGEYVAGASGGILGMDADGDSFAEVARLWVRVKAFFEELTIIKAGVLAGKQYITPGGGIVCVGVEEVKSASGSTTAYRCYFLSEQDGEKTDTKIVAGDQAISEVFNAKTGTANKVSNHRYWRLVTAVNNDAYTDGSGNHYGYIELSATDCEAHSDVPAAGDEICQLGNRNDKDRQSAMVFSTVDADAPSVKLFGGIGSGSTEAKHYSLGGKAIVSFGRDPLTGKIFFRLGPSGAAQYLEYTQDGGLTVAGRISTLSTFTDAEGNDTSLEDYLRSKDGSSYAPNLVVGSKEVVVTASTSNARYSEMEFDGRRDFMPGEKYTVSVDDIENLIGEAEEYSVTIFRFAGGELGSGALASGCTLKRDTPYGTMTLHSAATKENRVCLLVYAGKFGSTAGNSVKYTKVMLAKGDTPMPWVPAASEMVGTPGANGQDVYLLDLDNEMVAVACDVQGNMLSGLPATITARVFKGGTELSSGVTYSNQSTTLSMSQSGNVFTINKISKDRDTLVIEAVVAGLTLRSTVTFYKVRPGEDGTPATVYSLETSVTNVTRSASTGLSATVVGCRKFVTAGDAQRQLTTDNTLTATVYTNGVAGTETVIAADGVSNNGSVTLNDDTTAVVFTLYKGTSTSEADMLDRERVPVLTDAFGLAVGGVNLLRKTNQGTTNWKINCSANGQIVMSPGVPVSRCRFLNNAITGTPDWQMIGFALPTDGSIKANSYYMLSFRARVLQRDGQDGGVSTQPVGLRFQISTVTGGQLITNMVNCTVKSTAQRFTMLMKTTGIPTTQHTLWAYVSAAGTAWEAMEIWDMQLEEGVVATEYKASPLDFNYLTEALKESTTIDGGVILSSLMRLGYTQAEGDYRITAGMNGVLNPAGNGEDIAVWTGGEMVDATDPENSTVDLDELAEYAMRHNGNGYMCGGVVRVLDGRILIGRNRNADGTIKSDAEFSQNCMILDEEGLTYVADGHDRLRVTSQSVGDDFETKVEHTEWTMGAPQDFDGFVFNRYYSRTEILQPGQPLSDGETMLSAEYLETYAWVPTTKITQSRDIAITAGALNAGNVVQVSGLALSFTLARPNGESVQLTAKAELCYTDSAGRVQSVRQVQLLQTLSGSICRYSLRTSIRHTVAVEAAYFLRVTLTPNPNGVGSMVANTTTIVAPRLTSASGTIETTNSDITIIGTDGIKSIWGNGGILANAGGVKIRGTLTVNGKTVTGQ